MLLLHSMAGEPGVCSEHLVAFVTYLLRPWSDKTMLIMIGSMGFDPVFFLRTQGRERFIACMMVALPNAMP